MRQRVLVVDDHRRNIEILERLLKNDYEIRSAESGQEALDIAISFRPDIILLDIMMPDMDGYETCRRAREIDELAGTKIIMVSARAMVSERLEGYRAGADDYITKPFDFDELKAKVGVYMRLRNEEDVTREVADLIAALVRRTESPLSYIRDALHLLERDKVLSSTSRKLVSISRGCVTAILNATHEVELMAAINMSEITVDPVPVSLSTAIKAAWEEAAWLSQRRNTRIEITSEADVLVMIDEKQFSRTLLSLIDFLIRNTARGGLIQCSHAIDTDAVIRMETTSPRDESASEPNEDDAIAIRIAESIVSQHEGTLIVNHDADRCVGFELRLPCAGPVVTEPSDTEETVFLDGVTP